MFSILLVASVIIVLLFGYVVAFGAPFLPTLANRVDDALDLLDLRKGQTLLELGSGDGRLLKAAAGRGVKCIGYELNPLLVLYSKLVCFKQRKNVTIIWGNYWRTEWPKADGIYVFLLNPYMEKLHNRVVQYSKEKSIKVVSFAFEIKQKKPVKQADGMFLYHYKKA